MSKTSRMNSMVTFYLRKKYRPLFEEYMKLIEKDEGLKKQRYKKGDGLLSISILNLMYGYVLDQNPNFKFDVTKEDKEDAENQDTN